MNPSCPFCLLSTLLQNYTVEETAVFLSFLVWFTNAGYLISPWAIILFSLLQAFCYRLWIRQVLDAASTFHPGCSQMQGRLWGEDCDFICHCRPWYNYTLWTSGMISTNVLHMQAWLHSSFEKSCSVPVHLLHFCPTGQFVPLAIIPFPTSNFIFLSCMLGRCF